MPPHPEDYPEESEADYLLGLYEFLDDEDEGGLTEDDFGWIPF